MSGSHVAIFTSPGNRAHMYPVLELCAELVKRGYRVTYATDSHNASVIRGSGAEPVVFVPPEAEVSEERRPMYASLRPLESKWWEMFAEVYYPWLLKTAAVTVSTLEGFYRAATPDTILYDGEAIGGRILAELLECQAIQLFPHFAYHGNFRHWQNGVPDYPEKIPTIAEMFDSFLSAYGIGGEGNLWHTENLNIHFIPKVFQYHGDAFDNRHCFVGPCLNRPFRACWKDRSEGRPVVLITDTTGWTDGGYFNVFIDALCGSRYQVVLSVGDHFPEAILKDLPPNFEVNRHASHLEILPHVSLFISQGGMGGTLEAIYHGIPVIALPLTPYHEEIAYRVAALGLGLSLPRQTMTSEMIRVNVNRVLSDTQLLGRVKDMQRIFRDCGGAVLAADRISESLGVSREGTEQCRRAEP